MAAQIANARYAVVHGGGDFVGASSEVIFDGECLARHGVVLVSSNYRLGVFGFYAHPELTAEFPHHDSTTTERWIKLRP